MRCDENNLDMVISYIEFVSIIEFTTKVQQLLFSNTQIDMHDTRYTGTLDDRVNLFCLYGFTKLDRCPSV